MHDLHPSLRRYFSAIPAGWVGLGAGVFAEFGTERRWLWPLLRLFEQRGVLYAGHARSVRFRIVNRTEAAQPAKHPEAARTETMQPEAARPEAIRPEPASPGDPLAAPDNIGVATARRELELPGGTWVMHDSVAFANGRVVDRIGAPHTVSVVFDVRVENTGLTLTSKKVGFALGKIRIRVPSWFAPKVRLTEQHDPVSGLQRVALTIDAPIIGRVYGYRGHFSYGLVKEHHDER